MVGLDVRLVTGAVSDNLYSGVHGHRAGAGPMDDRLLLE